MHPTEASRTMDLRIDGRWRLSQERLPTSNGSPCSPRQHQPAADGECREHRGKPVAEQGRGSNGTGEGRQVRRNVVDRGDEAPVDDMGDGYHEPAGEGDREQRSHHERHCPWACKPEVPTDRQVRELSPTWR